MESSPTALFESYEQDFKTIISSIRDKVEVEAAGQKGGRSTVARQRTTQPLTFHGYNLSEQRKATLRFVEMELDEADEMVRAMHHPFYF